MVFLTVIMLGIKPFNQFIFIFVNRNNKNFELFIFKNKNQIHILTAKPSKHKMCMFKNK
jgi:hypothetical protein